MASAEQLLNEAQYAFSCISFGESPDNKRNASRARSLCRKIVRKFPASTEAAEAHAVLRRLGDEAYVSNIAIRHRHTPQPQHHRAPADVSHRTFIVEDDVETLDWGGLVSWLLALPKAVLAVIVLAGLFLYGIVGPFMLLPLIAFVLFSTPFRRVLKPGQRENLDSFIARANDFIAAQRG